jgi:hypothetical protein
MTAKKTTARAKQRTPVKLASARKQTIKALPSHAAALNDMHTELTQLINDFLQTKNIPLQLHSIRLAAASPTGFNCCMIGGMVHCGPECP